MPVPHQSAFTGQMPFVPPNQQRQSTEGIHVYGTVLADEIHSFMAIM